MNLLRMIGFEFAVSRDNGTERSVRVHSEGERIIASVNGDERVEIHSGGDLLTFAQDLLARATGRPTFGHDAGEDGDNERAADEQRVLGAVYDRIEEL